MNKQQRNVYGISEQDWKDALYRVREAMVGGKCQYHSRKDPHGRNGQQGEIVKVVKSRRIIEIRFDSDGSRFQAFGHNVTFC